MRVRAVRDHVRVGRVFGAAILALLFYFTDSAFVMFSGFLLIMLVLATAPKRVTHEQIATYIIPAMGIFAVGLGVIWYVIDPSHQRLFVILIGGILLLPQMRHSRVDAYLANEQYPLLGVGLACLVYGLVVVEPPVFRSIFAGLGAFACVYGGQLARKRR